MADYPPYKNAYGNVTKILNKIKEAKTPDRFSQDYLETVLRDSFGCARHQQHREMVSEPTGSQHT